MRDKDQKLIGVVNFDVDWLSESPALKEGEVLPFQKCIDPNATITVSAKLLEKSAQA